MSAPTLQLHPDQQAAVALALDPAAPRVLVITGAPGVGKTTVIRALLDRFEALDLKVALAAPTGKAALRMTQQTGRPAATIHRLLEPAPTRGAGTRFRFTRDAARPLDQDVLILDEVSMVDVPLMAAVCRAIRTPTLRRLIIVGDLDQLPAVGAGQVLGDLIGSGRVPVARLTTIKRQNPGALLTAIHAIKDGRAPKIDNAAPGADLFFYEVAPREDEETGERGIAPADVAAKVLDLALDRLPRALPTMFPDVWKPDAPVDALRDIQVITPMRDKGELSAAALGLAFQARLNPPALGDPSPPRLRFGDKVIQLKNDYDLGICNGDIGFVRDVFVDERSSKKMLKLEFDSYPGRSFAIPAGANNLALAYAVTCHKYQGSEAPVVIIPLHASMPGMLLSRNWSYTAISRARHLCILVGDRSALDRAIKRTAPTRRVTGLASMIRAGAGTGARA